MIIGEIFSQSIKGGRKSVFNIEVLEEKTRQKIRFTGGDAMNCWKIFLTGIVAGVCLLLVIGAGYKWAGTPEFCGSCHSMERVQRTWQMSTHRQFDCIECHLPHRSFAEGFIYKAKAGMRDVSDEFGRNYNVVTPVTPEARKILQDNCLRCHSSTVAETRMNRGETQCTQCHRDLVHGRGEPKGVLRSE
jgi:cytochrome c nitrite reductase small subunit